MTRDTWPPFEGEADDEPIEIGQFSTTMERLTNAWVAQQQAEQEAKQEIDAPTERQSDGD